MHILLTEVLQMKKPVLVIMAAGMGSRYGGLKQIDPVDADGHIIMDFSIYDAVRAGFRKVVFIIKRENEQAFRETIGRRVEGILDVSYVYQELENIPDGFSVPEGRIKPWGTGHAVLCCRDVIDGPFAVINADDYYGPEAFSAIYQYLTGHEDDGLYRYAMVSYRLGNTLTENGHVSRGICTVSDDGYLTDIQERTYIVMTPTGAAYSEDDGRTLQEISPDERVSMNMWGFTESFMGELNDEFIRFLAEEMPGNPMKAEYFLPSVVNHLLDANKATVKVLHSNDKWYGVTYKEDKSQVVAAIARLKQQGVYPDRLIE